MHSGKYQTGPKNLIRSYRHEVRFVCLPLLSVRSVVLWGIVQTNLAPTSLPRQNKLPQYNTESYGTTCFFSLLGYERLAFLFRNKYMLNFKTCSIFWYIVVVNCVIKSFGKKLRRNGRKAHLYF